MLGDEARLTAERKTGPYFDNLPPLLYLRCIYCLKQRKYESRNGSIYFVQFHGGTL
jgi:hypothetical protein